jgi:hypothetical protein
MTNLRRIPQSPNIASTERLMLPHLQIMNHGSLAGAPIRSRPSGALAISQDCTIAQIRKDFSSAVDFSTFFECTDFSITQVGHVFQSFGLPNH